MKVVKNKDYWIKGQRLNKGMHNFRTLQIWTDAMELAKVIYDLVADISREERYGLVSQLRRCAVSVPSNIAEGSSRTSDKGFAHFLRISLGSCYEIETQVILAYEFGYFSKTQCDEVLDKLILLQKKIVNFIKTLDVYKRKE